MPDWRVEIGIIDYKADRDGNPEEYTKVFTVTAETEGEADEKSLDEAAETCPGNEMDVIRTTLMEEGAHELL